MGTLREAGNRRVIQLLNLIRSNASLDEVRLYIDEQLGRDDLEHTPELEDVRTEIRRLAQSNVQSRRRVLDVNRLADTPVYNVPAKPWTRLSDDDSFVSHLVSLWFTWFHPTYNWIDRNLFIKDMQAGNLDCQYCSPFLVNIILADACVSLTEHIASGNELISF